MALTDRPRMSTVDYIKDSLARYKELKAQLDAGDITQSDFVKQAGSFITDASEAGHQLAGSGSNNATAAIGAGLLDLHNYAREYNAYAAGQDLLGRDITKQELADFLPKFTNYKDVDTGRAYIGQLAQQEAKSPQALRKKSGQYSGQVTDVFTNLLGRDATANEKDYYGSLLATGEISPYEIEGLVKRGDEYQGQADTKFREGLKDELMGYNREALGKAGEDIIGRLKQAGITDAENLGFALTDAEKDLLSQNNQFLSGLSSEQYGGNKAMAVSDYKDILDQYLGNQAYGRQRSDSKLDYLTGRADSLTDYARQKQDMMDFLNSQPKKKKSGLGAAVGTLLGGGIGAMYGNPMAGATMGQAGGGIFDYLLG